MKRRGADAVRRDSGGCESFRDPFLQLESSASVEREQQYPIQADEAASHGVCGPRDHHRRLSGTGSGQHLHTIVEAQHRACLLVCQRGLLDRVEKWPLGDKLGFDHPLVRVGRQLLEVNVRERRSFQV
jgi:hypothetical protein